MRSAAFCARAGGATRAATSAPTARAVGHAQASRTRIPNPGFAPSTARPTGRAPPAARPAPGTAGRARCSTPPASGAPAAPPGRESRARSAAGRGHLARDGLGHQRVLFLHVAERRAAGEHHAVHRELGRAQVDVEEVVGHDERGQQHHLVGVDDRRDVEDHARQEPPEELREPQQQAGRGDDAEAQEHHQVVELLAVAVAAEPRLGPLPHRPAQHLPELAEVAALEQDRIGTPEQPSPVLRAGQQHRGVPEVGRQARQHHAARPAMHQPGAARAAPQRHQLRRPRHAAEAQRQSGEGQDEEGHHQQAVQRPLEDAEPPDVRAAAAVRGIERHPVEVHVAVGHCGVLRSIMVRRATSTAWTK